jgi:hypothetical protein
MCNGQYPTEKCPFGCNSYVTAVAAGQSQRFYFYSGVGVFNWYYLSSPPQVLRSPRVGLELGRLIYIYIYIYNICMYMYIYYVYVYVCMYIYIYIIIVINL